MWCLRNFVSLTCTTVSFKRKKENEHYIKHFFTKACLLNGEDLKESQFPLAGDMHDLIVWCVVKEAINSPNRFAAPPNTPPPPPTTTKKLPWLKIWLPCKRLRVFSAYEMTLATYEILSGCLVQTDACQSSIIQ